MSALRPGEFVAQVLPGCLVPTARQGLAQLWRLLLLCLGARLLHRLPVPRGGRHAGAAAGGLLALHHFFGAQALWVALLSGLCALTLALSRARAQRGLCLALATLSYLLMGEMHMVDTVTWHKMREPGLGAEGDAQPGAGAALPAGLHLPGALPLLRAAAALRLPAPAAERRRQQLLRGLPLRGHGHAGRLRRLPREGPPPLGPGRVAPAARGAAPLHGRRRHQLEPAHVPLAARLRVPDRPAPGHLRGRAGHLRGQRPAARPQLPPGRRPPLPRLHHLRRARAAAAPGRHLRRLRPVEALPPRLPPPPQGRAVGAGAERGAGGHGPLPPGLPGRPLRRGGRRRRGGAGLRDVVHRAQVVGAELGQPLGDAGLLGRRLPPPLTGTDWEHWGSPPPRPPLFCTLPGGGGLLPSMVAPPTLGVSQ
ncbi:protein-serine O-palmitoleoyltransferase porcupine isoform X6 [Struthio camelus]|uniref:protein-serine O-palmitoleoyltransferase porcupine isoform X6 n=1 Tax=Struthio camelus TaxID=8801 RepID=UPI003603BF6D